ncbi:MmgE/PrpD family protein [Terrarubrum flagellatum]|uniref:MmgE/PrpD family protein n=1 Tax=Terrirubrum flagellatum TaxID=2895980 RepID=UPI003144F11F
MSEIACAEIEDSFAALVAGAALEISPEAEATAAEHLTDLVGVALAAVEEPAFRALLRTYEPTHSGRNSARVWGTQIRLPRRDAALMNAFAGHFHDFDDDETELAMAHVTVTAATAALTTADSVPGATGKRLLRAYIHGVETATRLGRLINPEHYRRGWHASATLGVFAAAAASGHVIGVRASEMRHALGIAASFASGLRSNFGSDAKPLQVASAVAQGMLASELAVAGLTSTPGSLLGPNGYTRLFGEQDVSVEALLNFGAPFDLVGSGLTIKAFPCCTAAHTAVDALLGMTTESGVAPSQIDRVTCWVDPAVPNILTRDRPGNALEAKFSMPFCLAAASIYGRLRLSEFKDEIVRSAAVQEMMNRIEVRTDSNLPKGPSGISVSSRVRLKLRDGSQIERFSEYVPGGPHRRLTHDQLRAKFNACVVAVLDRERVAAAFDSLLDVAEAKDCRSLLDLICQRQTNGKS